MADAYQRFALVLLWILAILGAAWMWAAFSQYVFEDAFITYRYADNIASGRGFVFTEGERVLGTTAPLYTLVLAGAARLGLDIPVTSGWIFAASIAATAVLGGLILRQLRAPTLGLLFALFVVSGGPEIQRFWGLETPFLTALLLAAVYLAITGRETWAAVVVAAAFLTRYDAALFAILYFALLTLRDRRVPWRSGLLATAIVLPWLVFAQLYFGSVLPNTLGAKVGDSSVLGYLAEMSQRQGAMMSRFLRATGFHDAVGTAAGAILASALVLGLVVFSARRWRTRPLELLLLLHPVALFAGYAVIGPSVNFLWYPVPGVVLLVAAALLGLSELARIVRIQWLVTPAALAAVAVAAPTVPDHFGAHATQRFSGTQYRFRVEAYRDMVDWVIAAGLQDETLMTLEPGYFVYHSGNPAIDQAGLVTKGIYFHGDPGRRTSADAIRKERNPGLLVTAGGFVPPGYLTAYTTGTKFELLVERSVFQTSFDAIREAHRRIADVAVPDIGPDVDIDIGPRTAGRWRIDGGIASPVGRPFPLTLDGEPYGQAYMFAQLGQLGAQSPSFRLDSDRVEFLMAATDHPRCAAQLLVDGRVVATERGRDADRPSEMRRIVWDVTPWRGRVGSIRFVQRTGKEAAIAFDALRTRSDTRRRLVDDFESGHDGSIWSERLGEGPSSLLPAARAHGLGLLASEFAAHSFGRGGTSRQVSRPLRIDADDLRFRWFDFGNERTRVELEVDGAIVRELVGTSDDVVRAVTWDVSELRGRTGVLRVIDGAEKPTEWTGIDDVVLATR